MGLPQHLWCRSMFFTQGLSQGAAVPAAFALLPAWCFPSPLLIKCVGLNAEGLLCQLLKSGSLVLYFPWKAKKKKKRGIELN